MKLRCNLRVTSNCPRQKKKKKQQNYALQRKCFEELPTVHERVDPYSGFNMSQETFNKRRVLGLKEKVRI